MSVDTRAALAEAARIIQLAADGESRAGRVWVPCTVWLVEVMSAALARSAPEERGGGEPEPDALLAAYFAGSVDLRRTVAAVAHELEHGPAGKGDLAAIAWCAKMLRVITDPRFSSSPTNPTPISTSPVDAPTTSVAQGGTDDRR